MRLLRQVCLLLLGDAALLEAVLATGRMPPSAASQHREALGAALLRIVDHKLESKHPAGCTTAADVKLAAGQGANLATGTLARVAERELLLQVRACVRCARRPCPLPLRCDAMR